VPSYHKLAGPAASEQSPQEIWLLAWNSAMCPRPRGNGPPERYGARALTGPMKDRSRKLQGMPERMPAPLAASPLRATTATLPPSCLHHAAMKRLPGLAAARPWGKAARAVSNCAKKNQPREQAVHIFSQATARRCRGLSHARSQGGRAHESEAAHGPEHPAETKRKTATSICASEFRWPTQ